MQETDAAQAIHKLTTAFNTIHSKEHSQLRLIEYHKIAFDLVVYNHGQLLYKAAKKSILEKTSDFAESFLALAGDKADFFKKANRMWDEFLAFIEAVATILLFMDYKYCETQKQLSTRRLAFSELKARLEAHPAQLKIISGFLMAECFLPRMDKGETGDFIKILLRIDEENKFEGKNKRRGKRALYKAVFEDEFVLKLDGHYRSLFNKLFGVLSPAEYLGKVNDLLKEQKVCDVFFGEETREDVLKTIKRVATTKQKMLEIAQNETNGLPHFLKSQSYNDIILFFTLVSDSKVLKAGYEAVNSYSNSLKVAVDKLGDQILKSSSAEGISFSNCERYVTALIDSYQTIEKIARNTKNIHFTGNSLQFDKNNTLLILSAYYDHLQRKGLLRNKKDIIKSHIGKLFILVGECDKFEELFFAYLEQRLFGPDSRLREEESEAVLMSEKLVFENQKLPLFSASFSSNLSKCLQSFGGKCESPNFKAINSGKTYPINVQQKFVPFLGFPSLKSNFDEAKLPPFLREFAEESTRKYKENKSNFREKLTFVPALNFFCFDIVSEERQAAKQCEADMAQTLILLLFNDFTSITFNRVLSETGLPIESAQKALISMLKEPNNVINGKVEGGDFGEEINMSNVGSCEFELNEKFHSDDDVVRMSERRLEHINRISEEI